MTTGWHIANVIAQSIGALGTMGALIVAVRVYRRQEDDSRREQARRVTVKMDNRYTIVVANHSDLPITAFRHEWTVVSDRVSFSRDIPDSGIGPGGSETFLLDHEAEDVPFEVSFWGVDVAAMQFEDAAGRCWRRTSEGVLRPLPPREGAAQRERKEIRSLRRQAFMASLKLALWRALLLRWPFGR